MQRTQRNKRKSRRNRIVFVCVCACVSAVHQWIFSDFSSEGPTGSCSSAIFDRWFWLLLKCSIIKTNTLFVSFYISIYCCVLLVRFCYPYSLYQIWFYYICVYWKILCVWLCLSVDFKHQSESSSNFRVIFCRFIHYLQAHLIETKPLTRESTVRIEQNNIK